MNFYQHAKHQAISSISSDGVFDLKILQFEWLRAFWPTNIWGSSVFLNDTFCRYTADHINFWFRANAVKIWDQIFSINSKSFILAHVCSIFPVLKWQQILSTNSDSVMWSILWASEVSAKVWEKLMIPI